VQIHWLRNCPAHIYPASWIGARFPAYIFPRVDEHLREEACHVSLGLVEGGGGVVRTGVTWRAISELQDPDVVGGADAGLLWFVVFLFLFLVWLARGKWHGSFRDAVGVVQGSRPLLQRCELGRRPGIGDADCVLPCVMECHFQWP
jgi:hypothetical protein